MTVTPEQRARARRAQILDGDPETVTAIEMMALQYRQTQKQIDTILFPQQGNDDDEKTKAD